MAGSTIINNRLMRQAVENAITLMTHDRLNERLAASTVSTIEEITISEPTVTVASGPQPVQTSVSTLVQQSVPVPTSVPISVPQSVPKLTQEGATASAVLNTEPLGSRKVRDIRDVFVLSDELRNVVRTSK